MKNFSKKARENQGITLITLVVTIIVLLILSAITLGSVFGKDGVLKRATGVREKYNEAKVREVLEIVLLDAQNDKYNNSKYNQDDFLNKFIKDEIPEADIKGDIVIIESYAYELNRSVPEIGKYLGTAEDLVFPNVTVTEPELADDFRTATFTATAIEATNGINKIELWIGGKIISTQTKTYDNEKEAITQNFTVNRDGVYTIKVYGKVMASAEVTVEGIVPAVEFSPDGSETWAKKHTVQLIVRETGDKITSLKYKWMSEDKEPSIGDFIDECPGDRKVTGGNETMIGTYYLHVLVTTESGKTNICRSGAFNFDNEAPTVKLAYTPVSETSFTLTATANDNNKSGVTRYDFYVGGEKVNTQTTTEGTATYTWNDSTMGWKECKVIVSDKLTNGGEDTIDARTKMHTWTTWTAIGYDDIECVDDDAYSPEELEQYNPNAPLPVYGAYENIFGIYTWNINKQDLADPNAWWQPLVGSANTSATPLVKCGNDCYFSWDRVVLYKLFVRDDNMIMWQRQKLVTVPKYRQGEYQFENSYGTKKSDYPEDGYQDGRWYVYVGIQ